LHLFRFFTGYPSARHKETARFIQLSFGVKPKNIDVYLTALRHKSAAKNVYNGQAESNERLEFLGDAVLDAVVAEYLYRKYREAEEGELTQMKSRIVSRSNLNGMAKGIGMPAMLETDAQAAQAKESISGNALEAVFGAMYLDRGYDITSTSIMHVLERHADLSTLTSEEADFKSRLFELAHKQKVTLTFVTRAAGNAKLEKRFVTLTCFIGSE
jgi:ribonuclease III